MIILGDVSQSELVMLMKLLIIAMHNQPARWDMRHQAKLDNKGLDYYRDAAKDLHDDLTKTPEPKPAKVDIDFADYLTTADLLISLEVARLALGDKLRRGSILQPMGMPETDADLIRLKLNRLMAAIKATEKQIPPAHGSTGPHFPALESGPDENAH